MGGNIDDLNVALNVDYQESLDGLREVVSTFSTMQGTVAGIAPVYRQLNEATAQLAATGSLPVKNAELLMTGLGSIGRTIETLQGQLGRMDTRLEVAVGASSTLAEHWQYVNRDVRSTSDSMRQFAEQAKAAAAATQTIIIDTATNKMQTPKKTATWDMVKLASAAMAMKAIDGVSNAMTNAKTAIAQIGTTTQATVSSLDRFRMGLAAPAVNPALNTIPALIQNITSKVAGAVESFRGFGDATINGLPAIMTSIAGGMGKVLGAGDNLQATVSKLTSQFDIQKAALDRVAAIYPTTGTAIEFVKSAMSTAAPIMQTFAEKVDAGNAAVREATISARNLAFIATGSFAKTGTSADTYARGAFHALLPMRLMAFEAKFAAGSMTLLRRAVAAVTSPVHAVQMAFQRGKGELKELRSNLPPLTGGLQLATRAMRIAAYSSYGMATAFRTLKTVATPITFIGRQIWNLVRPAQAAKVGLDGIAVGGQKAGLILRGITSSASGAASALGKVGTASAGALKGSVGGGFRSMASGAMMAGTAVAGLSIAMVGMGTSTAMATEKNQAVFGVMLKDMEQGKAVVASLQNSAAVGLFDNDEVLNSGRLLFKAGVAAVDLSAKTDQLATIAAATSTELGDLTRIYQQGANRGSFGQDKINQMAERGIDIYHALEATTGKSGAALADMISSGKIGITEMDAALAHLTEGNGIYAGSLETLGGTTSGMLATIKTNIMQALGTLMGAGTEARKPFLEMLAGWSESIKANIAAVTPVVSQFMATIKGMFGGLANVATTTYGSLFGGASATFGGILSVVMEWVTKFRWFFENIVPVVQFTGLMITSIMVTAFNDIAYWLTDTMPAYLTWFGENWKNIFSDIFNGTMAVFTNLGKNIAMAMTQIWAFITSGGTAELQFAWTPLLDGFQSTVAQLPDIPERAMTELEQSLQEQTQQIGTQLADSFDALNIEAQAAITVAPPEMPAIDPNLKSGETKPGSEDTGNKRTSFAVSNLERGSQAALDAIFASQKSKIPDKQLNEAKQTNKHLAKIAAKPAPTVLAGVP